MGDILTTGAWLPPYLSASCDMSWYLEASSTSGLYLWTQIYLNVYGPPAHVLRVKCYLDSSRLVYVYMQLQ